MCSKAYEQLNKEIFVDPANPHHGGTKPTKPYVYVFEALGRFCRDGNVKYLYRVGKTKKLLGFMSREFKALNRPRRFALLMPDNSESAKREAVGWCELSEYLVERLKCRVDFEYEAQFGLKWFSCTHNSTTVDAILHNLWEERGFPKSQLDVSGK